MCSEKIHTEVTLELHEVFITEILVTTVYFMDHEYISVFFYNDRIVLT